ncbi:MAG TPA: hypothetical protein V6D15_00090 [Oculatellaceae cyanobacterium]|jgi:hypothetical protein
MKTFLNIPFKVICASLVLGLPLISLMATAEPITRVKQSEAVKKICLAETETSPATQTSVNSQNVSAAQAQATANFNARNPSQILNITLINKTNTSVCYQALKYTGQRDLAGQSEVTLKNLPTPVTVTMFREDGGLLRIISNRKAQSLTVTLEETTDLANDKQALIIGEDGKLSAF